MKIGVNKLFFVFFIAFFVQKTFAQDPNWTVNTANYQFNMSFTTFLNVNGTTLTTANDKVAAFVNGEVRGVANVVYVASVNKYVAYLSVYANTDKEKIDFKIYDSTQDLVVDIEKSATFKIDAIVGGIFKSYSIANPALNDKANITSFNFEGIQTVATEISSDKITIVLPENTNLSSLKPIYITSTNSKVFVNDVLQQSGISTQNFTNAIIYHVLSEDEATLKEYTITVVAALNADPVTVSLTTQQNLNTNTTPISLNVAFSKPVSGFNKSDFSIENAVISNFTELNSENFNLEIVPLSQGEVSIQIPEKIAVDVNNNKNLASNILKFTYDISKPIIETISLESDENSWWFLVSFSEEVENVDVSDFKLISETASDISISNVLKISDKQYRVNNTKNNISDYVVSLALKSTNDIKDVAGNLIVFQEFETYFLERNQITVTADVKTKTYGEEDPELTYQITSGELVEGDVLTGNLTRELGEDVGEYIISSTLENDNYEITFVYNNLIITKGKITVTADAKTKTYGEEDPELTHQITSGELVEGDVLTGNLTRELGENVGEYVISSTLENDNYEITFVSNNLIITKGKITVTADAKTKTYGEEDPELTHQITSGELVEGDVLTGNLTRELGENVGEYVISSTLENDNYEITFVSNALTISKKEITVTTDAKTKTYGEEDIELTYQITSGELVEGDVLEGVLTRELGENVGEYAILSTLENDNYEIIFVSNNLIITKREITVTADAKTKTYGEEDVELTYQITSGSLLDGDFLTGNITRELGENLGEYIISSTLENDNYEVAFVSNNFIILKRQITIIADTKIKIFGALDPELTYKITSGSLVNGDLFQGALNREVGENVGDYLISSTLLNSNYNITFIPANLRISARKGIVITADFKTKVYGEEDPELTYSITSGSLFDGDFLTGNVTRELGENVGEYAISSTLENDNYEIIFVPNNLIITKGKITVTADAKTKTYGEEDPELTHQITSGELVEGDVLKGVLTRELGENVGEYIISSTLENDNYEITFVSNNLIITKREITVTADAKTKTYGEEDPELTYKITSGELVEGDVLKGVLTRELGENIGEYLISSTLENDNYEITFVSNNFIILKREITVTADTKIKIFGALDPELTYKITSGSLVNGDLLQGALNREVGENVGDYLISSTLLNSNYNITFIPANLRISARKGIVITADFKTKVYGEEDPELTYSITSGSLFDGDFLTGDVTRDLGEDVGEYAISSTLENDNYEIIFVSNNLIITKREITVTADVKTKTYGEEDPELTYQITSGELVEGDVLEGVLTRELGENVGEYIISPTLENDNYKITFVSNNLIITKREITVTANTITKAKNNSDPELTYKITSGNLVNNDDFSGNLTREIGEEVGLYKIKLGSLTLGDNYKILFIEANLEISFTASLNDTFLAEKLTLFPNPIKNFINISSKISDLNKVIIFDINGKNILSKLILHKKEITLTVSHLKAGVYFVKVVTNRSTSKMKFVKF